MVALALSAGGCFADGLQLQATAPDTAFHPFKEYLAVSGAMLGAGLISDYFLVRSVLGKPDIDSAELTRLNTNFYINRFDAWALKLDPTNRATYETVSADMAIGIYCLPALLVLDGSIRHDWLDMLGMYLETQTATFSVYNMSPFGPNFQNKYRPIVYYTQLSDNQRSSGNNRNSFYSGHTASATTATFFMTKVYIDYHPELGWEKYLLYGAASVPPLVMGYLRIRALDHFPSDIAAGFIVGALIGVLDPEFHRIKNRNVSLASISTPDGGTGLCVKWGQQ
jgi:membrane-associated phospholipid phosphatase